MIDRSIEYILSIELQPRTAGDFIVNLLFAETTINLTITLLSEGSYTFERVKGLIDSLWAEHMAFRVAFVVTFLLSVIAVFVCFFFLAYSFFKPYFSWLVLVCLSVFIASRSYQNDIRRKYWWLPLTVTSFSLAFFAFHNYIVNQLNDLMFSAFLSLVAVGCLIFYFAKKKG